MYRTSSEMSILNLEMDVLFISLLVLIAFMYASVGHGGASGYIALMSIFSFPTAYIKPTGLILNIFISGLSFWYFKKQNHFRPHLFYAFAITSIPAAFVGGMLNIDSKMYKIILAVFLFIALVRILGLPTTIKSKKLVFKKPIAWGIGLIIGLFSGLIGIGGGIILSPIILLLGWGNVKTAAAVSALFIFVNSIAGIVGYSYQNTVDTTSFYFVPVVFLGGLLGAYYGSSKGSNSTLSYILSGVLMIASIKLLLY